MRILCVNAGSSSLKCSVQEVDSDGAARACLDWQSDGALDGDAKSAKTTAAVGAIFKRLGADNLTVDAIGHRFVFGGPDCIEPTILTSDILRKIEQYAPIAPLHIPVQTAFAQAIFEQQPQYKQMAAFDTAFHAELPALAQRFPLPAELLGPTLRRYGFHGLSYEYITSTHAPARQGRVVIAHLGSGASLAAVRDGKPHDTSMGLTPLGGLMMGSRPGDLDPGLLMYLLRTGKASLDELDGILEHKSGLIGVSGISSDVKQLIARRADDPAAKFALELFTYLLVKQIGAAVAALNGLDRLIFTGGIGEHSAEVRAETVAGLQFLGITINPQANHDQEETISTNDSRVAVQVVKTNENAMIARHAVNVLRPAATRR